MTEQGTDRYGAEYKRTNNDFHVRYLEQDNGICSVCHGTGAKIEIRYVVRNYESARVKNKICKNLQAHERSLWICPKCINNFKQKLSVINERNLTQPEPQWIPCSERLPEEYGEYQITWITSASKKRFIGSAEYEITYEWDEYGHRFSGEWLLDDYVKNYPDVKVTAWMPLPQPYKEAAHE